MISDQLSEYLDPGAFQFLGSSHPCSVALDTARLMTFSFFNILLPDSNTNEPGSHGFVRFKIKPKSNITLGSVIENTASIIFDINLPVITNTVVTAYSDLLSNIEMDLNVTEERKAFPNPALNNLYFPVEDSEEIMLFNLSGKEMKADYEPQNHLIKMNLAELEDGIYFIRIKGKTGSHCLKIIKM